MRIVKKETVFLSVNEGDILVEVFRMLEGIVKEAENPNVKFSAECIMNEFQNFVTEHCEFEKEDDTEEDDEFFFIPFE